MSLFSSEHSLEEQTEDSEFCLGTERWAPCPGQVFMAKVTLVSVLVLLKISLPEVLIQEQACFESQMV